MVLQAENQSINLTEPEISNMDIIELQNVTKTFGRVTAVKDLTLNVPKGCIYGFIGPNGSGKTTTIRMIMNILHAEHGKILIFGKEQNSSRTEKIGYLPEERGLYKKMKVAEVINFHGELKRTENLKNEIDYWLRRLDLFDRAKAKVETLSKGMTQKLQFIATVIDRPEIIILDEPFSGLDPVNAETIRECMLDLQKSGSTIIFSTHDMNMAERMCDHIFMIYRGEKVLDGTLESIQDKYGNDTIRIKTEAGAEALQGIEGIEKINDLGNYQEVRLKQNGDPQMILSAIIRKTSITMFELTRPSLNDIFIRIASPNGKEVDHV